MDTIEKEYRCPSCNTKVLFYKEPKNQYLLLEYTSDRPKKTRYIYTP